MAVEALTNLEKSRGSYGSMAQSALMGAGLGAKASQGAMNPLTAFLQGAAAGLQAPAQVFAQKQAQVKSTLDAIPFGVRFPELAKLPAYSALAGMPSAIALETVQGIARDTARVQAEGEQNRKTKEYEMKWQSVKEAAQAGIIAPDKQISLAQDYQKNPDVINFAKIDGEYATIKSMPNDIPGHTAILAKYIQLLAPTARLNESTMEVTDPSGTIDKWTKDMVAKVKGQGLMGADERAKIERVAEIMHSRLEAKKALYKSEFLENLKDTNFRPGLVGEQPKTFIKDGMTIKGYLINGQIIQVQ